MAPRGGVATSALGPRAAGDRLAAGAGAAAPCACCSKPACIMFTCAESAASVSSMVRSLAR
eukprot:7845241-Pyramimonas_sp.AAC.1